MYLLFSSTYNQVPTASVIDMKIKENLEKSGSAKSVALWNWTPIQKSLLDADLPRVIMTSKWSTGKTRILFVKALKLAKDGKVVIFVLHYSQIKEENKESRADEEKVKDEGERKGFRKFLPKFMFKQVTLKNPEKAVKEHNESIKGVEDFSETKNNTHQTSFSDHAPILLYYSLMNELDQESEKNPQVKANFKLMVSKDLKEDILEKNSFDNGGLVKRLLSFCCTYGRTSNFLLIF